MDIMELWSLKDKTPRESQIRCIKTIYEALDSYDNIILEAGVGIGKSAIATTLANNYNSYIVTMTNQLLNQYLNDFPNLYHIKGRSNYPCNYDGNCKNCYKEQMDERRCHNCKYLQAVARMKEEPQVLTNYDYLYLAGNYAGHFFKRNLIVFDEAHNLELKIMSLVSQSLNRRDIYRRYKWDIFEPLTKRQPLKSLDKDYWRDVLLKCIDSEKNIFCKNQAEQNKQKGLLNKYKSMNRKLKNYLIDLPLKKDILADKNISNDKLRMIIKPLKITNESNGLFRFGRKKLFMTGTLGDKDKFCEWNGIDSDDTFYHYEKSPFPVRNRPIYPMCVASMGNDKWENNALIKIIKRIIDKHKGQKGVIHTTKNDQSWWIKNKLCSNKVWVAQGKSRINTIKSFEESEKDLVLIGAGIKDGVDFNDDKCRFQILFKVPFPFLGDEQINRRKRLDESWYIYQTVMPLMQSYGRGVRNENDTCDYYILDRDFENVLKNHRYFFNEYFLEAIQ